ncbi:hypothetical protein A0H81_08026 [Grifola frondosa]|uniref:Uncharacterized protein n=1 Tax=Grifola frondosa TaxID=5627 RepID=A0A1C7M7F4_GRIFR|nr:hypothetical protein A0H81_08026 [Grifola frondosa]
MLHLLFWIFLSSYSTIVLVYAIELGGLGLSLRPLATVLGAFGVMDGLFQATFFAKFVGRGERPRDVAFCLGARDVAAGCVRDHGYVIWLYLHVCDILGPKSKIVRWDQWHCAAR